MVADTLAGSVRETGPVGEHSLNAPEQVHSQKKAFLSHQEGDIHYSNAYRALSHVTIRVKNAIRFFIIAISHVPKMHSYQSHHTQFQRDIQLFPQRKGGFPQNHYCQCFRSSAKSNVEASGS
jgi:hypothetical protein